MSTTRHPPLNLTGGSNLRAQLDRRGWRADDAVIEAWCYDVAQVYRLQTRGILSAAQAAGARARLARRIGKACK